MDKSIPWMEKYRPADLDDIVYDEQTTNHINIFMKNRINTHLILSGDPGTGKTTTVRCIAKRLLGDKIDIGYLELNAAEDRGIKSISNIIPPFCKKTADVSFKIILLDEADNITQKCQYDINDMIKIYGEKTKFIFTCNVSSKIIEDIQSVCKIIRFKTLTNDQMRIVLTKICKAESIPYTKNGIETICYVSNGDMRKAINNLQLTSFTYEKITKRNIFNICKIPNPEDIRRVLDYCHEQDITNANAALDKIISTGYHYLDIINSFVFVITNTETQESIKLSMINVVNQTKIIVSCGLQSKLQLTAMVCRLINTIK